MNEAMERDKEIAKNALRVYLQHFLTPSRAAVAEFRADFLKYLNMIRSGQVIN